MSALKIACKRQISRRLSKNRHITILSYHYSAVKLFWKYSNHVIAGSRHIIVT